MPSTIVHFDSRDRLEYSDTTSTSYVLPMPIILKEVVAARVISVEMPSSFYVFQASYGNTSLRVTVYDAVPVTHTITIPDGNYTPVSIASEVQKQLNAAFSPLSFECEVSQTTRKCTIENVQGYDVQVHTDDVSDHTEYSRTLPYFLGFEFDTISKGAPLTSRHVVSVNPFTYAYLDIPELGTGAYEGGMYGSRYSPSSNVFAKIPINNNSFEYTLWEPQTQTTVSMNPPVARLERLTVRWRFHDMTPIDFQNMDHSFSVEFLTGDPREKHMETIAENVRCIADALTSPGANEKREDNEISDPIPQGDDNRGPPIFSRNATLAILFVLVVAVAWMFSGRRTL